MYFMYVLGGIVEGLALLLPASVGDAWVLLAVLLCVGNHVTLAFSTVLGCILAVYYPCLLYTSPSPRDS